MSWSGSMASAAKAGKKSLSALGTKSMSAGKIGRGRITLESDVWEPGQPLPEGLGKYLKKIRTRDIMDHMEEQGLFGSKENVHHEPQHLARRLLKLPGFDAAMGVVILINLIAMIIDTDRSVHQDDAAGTSLFWTDVFGNVVLLIFVIELSVRLLALGCWFWIDGWNVFDFFVVSVDLIFSVMGLLAGETFPISILRIFRLAKIARVFKVLRVFGELRLLLAGLISSIAAIFWGTLLLFFCLLVWAMVGVLFIHPLSSSIDYNDCERCPRAYSSVLQATLTLWQSIVTGDGWGRVPIPVIEKYPATAVYFIAVYLTVGMAVTNLILGVVVNVAQQAQDALAESDHTEKVLEKLVKHTQLLQLCKRLDDDGDGRLTHEEVICAFDAPGDFHDILATFNISRIDFDIIWTILDTEKKGHVPYKELVSFMTSMKTSDAQFMLSYIKYYVTLLKDAVMHKIDEATAMGHLLGADMREIEEAWPSEQTCEEQMLKSSSVDTTQWHGHGQRYKAQARAAEELQATGNSMHSMDGLLAKGFQGSHAHRGSKVLKDRDAVRTSSFSLNDSDALFSSVVPGASSFPRNDTDALLSSSLATSSNTVLGANPRNSNPQRKGNAVLTTLSHLRHDIYSMQSDLKSALKAMDHKLDRQFSHLFGMGPSIMIPQKYPGLASPNAKDSRCKFSI